MPVKEVSNGNLKKELQQAGDKLVMIDFYATWCGPCKMIAPKIDKLSSSYSNVIFLKIDVDQCQIESQEYEISAMPTFVFIHSSKELERIRGTNIDSIETALKKYSKETSVFSGEGHSMLDTNPENTSTTDLVVESDRDRLEKIARERFSKVNDGEKLTALRLRLPDLATPINIRLSANQTLNDVRHLICETIPMFETTPFEFFEPPATKIQLDDESKTLEEAKLTNSALTIRKI